MIVFVIATWLLFGIMLGGFAAFFLEKCGNTLEHLAAGALGALIGGLAGSFITELFPSLSFTAGTYDFTDLVFAMMVSILVIWADRKTRLRGKHLFRDPRPDLP